MSAYKLEMTTDDGDCYELRSYLGDWEAVGADGKCVYDSSPTKAMKVAGFPKHIAKAFKAFLRRSVEL